VKSPPSVRTEMYIRQAGPRSYRQVLREVRHKEIFKLIVDTDPAHMQQFFRAVSLKRLDTSQPSANVQTLPQYTVPHISKLSIIFKIFLFHLHIDSSSII
jgi:hypothetical protein